MPPLQLLIYLHRSLFTVRYEPQKSLALGMDLRAEIEFRIREDDPDVFSTDSKTGFLDVSVCVCVGR